MSKTRVTQLQRLISAALDKAGLACRVEIGKKHRKLYVEGKMVMVFSHGACPRKDIDKVKSLVRRIQEHEPSTARSDGRRESSRASSLR